MNIISTVPFNSYISNNFFKNYKMPKRIRKCLFFLSIPCLLILVNSCARVDRKHFLFESALTVDHRFPMEVFNPMGMYIHNDYLILHQVNNAQSSEGYFFQVYNLSDGAFKGSFGRRGRGPGEWLSLFPVSSPCDVPYFYFYDMSVRESSVVIYKTMLDSIAQPVEVDSFSIEKGFSSMSRAVIKDDSLFLYNEFLPERAVRLYHLRGEFPLQTWTYGPSFDNQRFEDENMGTLHANDSCIVFLYNLKDRIDILDWNLQLKKCLNYQKGQVVMHQNPMENVWYYSASSCLGKHFLYVLYLGVPYIEFWQNNVLQYALEVFDLNGRPICRYTFPEPSPRLFVVDERTFNLYGYRGENDLEDFISVYHLPGLKEYLETK